MRKDVNRSAYTSRILEIVGNIEKQREEIKKVNFFIPKDLFKLYFVMYLHHQCNFAGRKITWCVKLIKQRF